jgi:hypothetical protein
VEANNIHPFIDERIYLLEGVREAYQYTVSPDIYEGIYLRIDLVGPEAFGKACIFIKVMASEYRCITRLRSSLL